MAKGDWQTCTTQTTRSDKHHDPLPINTDNAALGLEKRSAAMERWLLFSCLAADNNHTKIVNTACGTCAWVRTWHVDPSSVQSVWIKAGRRAPLRQLVKLYTPHMRECRFKTAELVACHGYHKNTTRHNFSPTTTNMVNPTPRRMTMSFGNWQGGSTSRDNQEKQMGAVQQPPPTVVETVVSSGQSLTSSIGIGEFGMNAAHRGNAATFSMAVKDNLFPKLKFLQGTNASLDFSMDTTSICGFLHLCCGVAEADAYQWWADHSSMLKNIHTDIRNNKIKMIKQQFNGKIVSFGLSLQDETSITTTTAHIFVDNKLGFRKISLKPQRSCNVHSCINASTWMSTSSSSATLVQPWEEWHSGMPTRLPNLSVSWLPSPMRHSFISASSTIVQPGRLRKERKLEKQM